MSSTLEYIPVLGMTIVEGAAVISGLAVGGMGPPDVDISLAVVGMGLPDVDTSQWSASFNAR